MWSEGHYIKHKFNVTNFEEVLTCLELIKMETHKFRTNWGRTPSMDIHQLSESMLRLKLEDPVPEDLKTVLSSIREELRTLDTRIRKGLRTLDTRIKALEEQAEAEEQQEIEIPEDPLTKLSHHPHTH